MIQREFAASIREADRLYAKRVDTFGVDNEMTLQLLATRCPVARFAGAVG